MRRILVFLTAGVLAASLAAPAAAMAGPFGGNVYVVPSSGGGNDTLAIQNALNACAAHGPGCTVQLEGGTYNITQLVTYNFQGTLRGVGEGRTTIEALPDLPVYQSGDPFTCLPTSGPGCQWPTLITFVNGTIEVSDLSIHEGDDSGNATEQWAFPGYGPLTALWSVLFFTGQRTDVSIDRVAIRGEHDATTGDLAYGFNLDFGVAFVNIPVTSPSLRGSLAVRDSSFQTMSAGVSAGGGPLGSVQVTIGGSPWAGNHFADVDVGFDQEGAQSSVFDVSYNVVTQAAWFDMWVVPSDFVPSSPSQYLIHDNTFAITAPYEASIWLVDDLARPWIQARVWDNMITLGSLEGIGISAIYTTGTVISGNTIRLQAPGSEGIDTTYTTGSVISGNTIAGGTPVPGSGEEDAIGLWSATGSKVIGNDVSRVTPDTAANGGLAQIYLGTSSYWAPLGTTPILSTDNLVVCLRSTDTVFNLGSGNTLQHCTQLTAPEVTPLARPAPRTVGVKPKPYFP